MPIRQTSVSNKKKAVHESRSWSFILISHLSATHAPAGLQLRVPVAKGLPPFHKAYDRLLCFATPANLPSLTPTLDTFGLRLSSVTDREHRGAASLEIFSNLFRRREDKGDSYASRPLTALHP